MALGEAVRGPVLAGRGAARRALFLVLVCTLAAAVTPAQEPADLPPRSDEPAAGGEAVEAHFSAEAVIAARLEKLEARLESLEDKLDRIDELLRLLFASKLRRVELLARNDELGRAIPAVEERYSIRNIAEALTEDDIERLAGLRKKLAGAAAAAGVADFAADPDVVAVLAAMAQRRDFLARHGRTFLTGVAGRDKEALGKLVLALLERNERDSPGAKEVALWAAPRAEGATLPARLSSLARELDEGEGRLYALAQAAAASHGDTDAAERLTRAVEEGEVSGAFAHGLAGELASAGSKAAFRIYLELVRDERYAFAASQAFNRIQGFDRRVGWREVRENRDGLYEEFKAWLERTYDRLHYEAALRRFTVE